MGTSSWILLFVSALVLMKFKDATGSSFIQCPDASTTINITNGRVTASSVAGYTFTCNSGYIPASSLTCNTGTGSWEYTPSCVREPDNSEFSIHSFFTAVTTTVVCLVAEMALL